MSRRTTYAALAAVCALPRIAVLLHERSDIVSGFTEKSDTIARMFLDHGTFGFVPGEPSAYTQPLYAWFLIPVYWLFGSSWQAVGLTQVAVAVATTWLVYEIGRRIADARTGIAAAAIATLNPYLVWHDVHVNREIVDQLVAAALVLLTLLVVERPTARRSIALGVVAGLSILGNTRLAFVPLLCAAYVVWRLPRARAAAGVGALVLAGSAVAVAPWLVRNKLDLGCWAVTTDGRAMWKANNERTYELLSSGQWIDNVGPRAPRPPEPAHLTPEEANGIWLQSHGRKILRPDECMQSQFFQDLALDYWREHPGGKARLMALSTKLLWQPNVLETADRSGAGGHLDIGRRVVEPAYMWALYVLAAAGLFVAPRPFVVLTLLLLAYQTAAAMAFVGATRYRVAWDFLLALLAATALTRIVERRAR